MNRVRVKSGDILGASAASLRVENNKGAAMLMRMGWTLSTGLGKDGQGVLEPIGQVVKFDKKSLR